MSAAVLFKVRCPSCGKSLKVGSADAASQMVCRACGARIEVPAAPLLRPLSGDATSVPVLNAVSARPITARWEDGSPAPTPSLPSAPPPLFLAPPVASAEVAGGEGPATWTFERAAAGEAGTAADWPADRHAYDNEGSGNGESAGDEASVAGGLGMTADDLPPWAAVSSVPETPPPPAVGVHAPSPLSPAAAPSIAVPSAPAPGSPPARLVPTRLEPPDPSEEQVRLGYAPRPIPPVVETRPLHGVPDSGVPTPRIPGSGLPGTPDESPSNDDVPILLAAHRAGQLRLVSDRQRHGHPFWWTMLGMLSASAIVLIALAATGQIDWFDPWEKQTAPAIAQIRAEAEALAVRGSLKEAHERYQKIDELVGGRAVRDAHLRQEVESAREAARSIYGILLSRMAQAPDPLPGEVPSPPATSVAADQGGTPGEADEVASAAPIEPAPDGSGPPPASPDVVEPEPREPTPQAKPAPSGSGTSKPEPQPNPPVVADAPAGPQALTGRVRPAPRPVVNSRDGQITDAEIGKSIEAGVDHLLKQFDATTHVVGSRQRRNDNAYSCGLDALAVYALLQAGQAIDDPRISHRGAEMKAKLEALRNLPIEGSHQTYARGLRATALALFNRGEDFKVMANDVDWLLGTTDGGAYTYNGDYKTITRRGNFTSQKGSWDNSNSQYGLLGVWSGIEADPRIEVPLAYWKAVDRHWTGCQADDGQWGYGEGGTSGRLTMTCAGIASLFVAHEYLEPSTSSGQVGREPFSPALKKGLEWFERGNNSVNVRAGGNWWGYTLYGIERVGLASGFKHFGSHDWYRELSEQIVRRQLGNGSWGDGVIDTSYALLFLSRGRHPILMNKLRFDGYWSNRPRDASNMARYAGRQFERPINWQVVNIENPWTDWTDSPILYIASHVPPEFSEEHLEKLRRFVRSGGMIFTHADAGSPAFDRWARELAAKLFTYELTELPQNHPLWTSVYKLTARPPLWGVSNGSRLLMLHSPSDITLKWQQRTDRAFESRPDAAKPATVVTPDSEAKTRMLSPFYFGMNLFVYASGKRDLRNRLDSAWVSPPESRPIDTIRVARLQYGGNWDPEPGAWERYANWFHQTTGTRLEVQPIKVGDLKADSAFTYRFAHLTGTARVGFTDGEAAALRAYVEGGGVVLIDSTGGMNAFDNDVRDNLLLKTLPDRFPRLLDASHPLMTRSAPGMEDVSKTIVRGYTLERLGGGIGTIQMVTPKSAEPSTGGPNPGAIIVTSLDLTSGLLGTNVWGVLGFQNSYSQSFVKNAIFWTIDGRPQQ